VLGPGGLSEMLRARRHASGRSSRRSEKQHANRGIVRRQSDVGKIRQRERLGSSTSSSILSNIASPAALRARSVGGAGGSDHVRVGEARSLVEAWANGSSKRPGLLVSAGLGSGPCDSTRPNKLLYTPQTSSNTEKM